MGNLTNKVIMYGFNFEHNFIQNVWFGNIANHLQSKFSNIYKAKGSDAAFFVFFTQLDETNKNILINYIDKK